MTQYTPAVTAFIENTKKVFLENLEDYTPPMKSTYSRGADIDGYRVVVYFLDNLEFKVDVKEIPAEHQRATMADIKTITASIEAVEKVFSEAALQLAREIAALRDEARGHIAGIYDRLSMR